MKSILEFRKDIVSGDWVLISTAVRKKPIFFKKITSKPLSRSLCPFDDPERSGNENLLLWLPRPRKNTEKDWWVKVFPNRFPVVIPSRACPPLERIGIHERIEGVGFQELVVTRDHIRAFGSMTKEEIALIIDAYHARFIALRNEPCVEYILIFHNHGSTAGATVPHPHSQIIALPIVPPHIAQSLEGSRRYFQKNRRCVHCDMLRWEKKQKIRILFENNSFIAVAPFASHVAFEIRIYPKIHEPHFETIDYTKQHDLAEAMSFIFSELKNKTNNPDYNFFIHTTPFKWSNGHHYHWHLEILPRMAIWGGLELGVGIEVVKIAPEQVSQILQMGSKRKK